MKSIRILFLGAGKRLSLLEKFQMAAEAERIELAMWSVERSKAVPIALVADVILGPGFRDEEFEGYVTETALRYNIDLIIPNMDSATVALSKLKNKLAEVGIKSVVSDYSLCVVMEDKAAAHEWFVKNNIPVPKGQGFPRIAKYRFGYGSRDQFVATRECELEGFLSRKDQGDYIIQPYIYGQEYTVDAYVDKGGRITGALSRKRIEVIAGEVEVSEAHYHPGILRLTDHILSVPGWEGPITLQFIDSPGGPVALEINPRFGGGVTHSIHCGLDMPRWIIREQIGVPVDPVSTWPDGSIMTRCRRDVFL